MRGGKRERAGRPSDGQTRKIYCIRVSDEERQAVKGFLHDMRAGTLGGSDWCGISKETAERRYKEALYDMVLEYNHRESVKHWFHKRRAQLLIYAEMLGADAKADFDKLLASNIVQTMGINEFLRGDNDEQRL